MARGLVIGRLRVQEISYRDGRRAYTIVSPEGVVHETAEGFLKQYEASGTDRTYAYLLVDHLRWLESEGLEPRTVVLRDLERYMGAVGAQVAMPLGSPWRFGRKPYGNSALSGAAACLKGFYLYQGALGVNIPVAEALRVHRLPRRADRDRSMLGHLITELPANPLAPWRVRRRHPKMLPPGAREGLLRCVNTARDRMIVTWLADGGFRVGELCGLHLMDLHLREDAACRECRMAHAHVCHRPGLANRARAKSKHPWSVVDGVVTGGLAKRVSPAIVHSYFEYVTGGYPREPLGHGQLLVQLAGRERGAPLAPDGVRRMLARAGVRAGVGVVKPHAFRHEFATAVLDASGRDLVTVREAGGWASTKTVEDIYAHADIHDPRFDRALRRVWGEGE